MYFQLEVDYYSNEANKNKYTNFPLIASIKNNLKMAEDQIVQGIVLTTKLVILLLGVESTLYFVEVYPLLSTNIGVSPLHGLIVASLRINQIYIKIDKVKIKPYLATP